MHLLIVEDERALCDTIARSLRRSAYSVDCCFDGEKALELLDTERYDLVLLDLNLPKKDGMTVLRTLRQTDRETPVLILSARSEVADKVEGLDAGANDYLAKPFHLAELEARIRSLTLRQFTQQDVLLTCGEHGKAGGKGHQPHSRHTGGGGHHVALGNAAVKMAVGIGFFEDAGLGGGGQIGVQHHHVGVIFCQFYQRGAVAVAGGNFFDLTHTCASSSAS